MKREAASCTKMKRLCRMLDIPLYAGIGILESIWHLTAKEAPTGNIGKLSDEDIALGIDWLGDSGKLVSALCEAHWLDKSEEHRLIVHDWHEHTDDHLDMKLARTGKKYATGVIPRMNRLTKAQRELLCATFGWTSAEKPQKATNEHEKPLPVPVPLPEPVPVPVPGELRAQDAPPSPNNAPEEIPEGLSVIQYRQFACEQVGIAKSYGNQVAFQDGIEAVARSEGVPLHVATSVFIERALARPPEDGKWKFWVDDGRWKQREEFRLEEA